MGLIRRAPVATAIVLAGLALVGVGATWMLATHNGPNGGTDNPPSSETRPQKVVLSGYVDVEGHIITLAPLQPGRVKKVLIRENDKVSVNQELILMDDDLANMKVREAQGDLDAAKALVDKALRGDPDLEIKLSLQEEAVLGKKSELKTAQLKFKRADKMLKEKVINQDEYDALVEQLKGLGIAVRAEEKKLDALKEYKQKLADRKLNRSKWEDDPDLIRAWSNFKAKEAQLDRARLGVRESVVRAPADGIILRLSVSPGHILGPQTMEPPILFTTTKERIIRVNVEQEFADRVKVGYLAEINDYINPNLNTWKGKVERVSDIFMPGRDLLPTRFPFGGDDTRTLECLVRPEGNPPLKLGQKVRVTIRPN